MQVRLPTNGKIEGYPSQIFMSFFKMADWELFASILESGGDVEKNMDLALTEVLDRNIDFANTGFVKTSYDLLAQDRLWLLIYNKINTTGSKFQISFECPKCTKRSVARNLDLVKAKLMVMDKKIKMEEEIELSDGNVLYLMPMTRRKMDSYVQEIADFNLNPNLRWTKVVPHKVEVDGKETGEMTNIVEFKSSFVSKILEEVYPYVHHDKDKRYTDMGSFLDYIMQLPSDFYKKIDEFREKIDCGVEYKTIFSCEQLDCKHSYEEFVPLKASFFLD